MRRGMLSPNRFVRWSPADPASASTCSLSKPCPRSMKPSRQSWPRAPLPRTSPSWSWSPSMRKPTALTVPRRKLPRPALPPGASTQSAATAALAPPPCLLPSSAWPPSPRCPSWPCPTPACPAPSMAATSISARRSTWRALRANSQRPACSSSAAAAEPRPSTFAP